MFRFRQTVCVVAATGEGGRLGGAMNSGDGGISTLASKATA